MFVSGKRPAIPRASNSRAEKAGAKKPRSSSYLVGSMTKTPLIFVSVNFIKVRPALPRASCEQLFRFARLDADARAGMVTSPTQLLKDARRAARPASLQSRRSLAALATPFE